MDFDLGQELYRKGLRGDWVELESRFMAENPGQQKNSTGNGVVLDVRGLAAPEDVLAILKKASELPKGSGMEIAIATNPFQLYDLLQQRGYFLNMIPQKDGTYRGYIKQREIEPLSH